MSAVRRVAIANDEASGYTTPGFALAPEEDQACGADFAESTFADPATSLEILALIDAGWPVAAIACALDITEAAVHDHAVTDLRLEPEELDTDWSEVLHPFSPFVDPERAVSTVLVQAEIEEANVDPKKYRDPARSDAADQWLAAHDPRLQLSGVKTEVEGLLADQGLTLADVRSAFPKSGGRPGRQVCKKRAQIKTALWPMWAAGLRRDYMAQALGIDRKTLRRLMS